MEIKKHTRTQFYGCVYKNFMISLFCFGYNNAFKHFIPYADKHIFRDWEMITGEMGGTYEQNYREL